MKTFKKGKQVTVFEDGTEHVDNYFVFEFDEHTGEEIRYSFGSKLEQERKYGFLVSRNTPKLVSDQDVENSVRYFLSQEKELRDLFNKWYAEKQLEEIYGFKPNND